MLEWTLSAFQSHPSIDCIVIAGAPEELDRLRAASAPFQKVSAVVAGGDSRQDSVGSGLRALPSDCELLLVHDAARPVISHDLISRVLDETRRSGAAIPGLPLSDTIKRVDTSDRVQETVDRTGLWAVQTPQGAHVNLLRQAYKTLGSRVSQMTDEAGVLEAAGIPVQIVMGEETNIKITHPGDIERVTAAMNTQLLTLNSQLAVRTGFGYDVHAFADGRPLWLGGVEIPHDRGLAGHSDADVLLHAACDALLGAAGMGDIGVLFPDTDKTHKDRQSIEFVREVGLRLRDAGWAINNIDVTLLAEAPRIGPHRHSMTIAISEGLEIDPGRVNIKATTSEGLGFVGRGEGIACWAVATLTRADNR